MAYSTNQNHIFLYKAPVPVLSTSTKADNSSMQISSAIITNKTPSTIPTMDTIPHTNPTNYIWLQCLCNANITVHLSIWRHKLLHQSRYSWAPKLKVSENSRKNNLSFLKKPKKIHFKNWQKFSCNYFPRKKNWNN